MSDKHQKYDPEDIEGLLLNKDFDELYEAEKAFVLRHVDSREEYESMQQALRGIVHHGGRDEPLIPNPDVKRELLKEFEEDRRGGVIWLNAVGRIVPGDSRKTLTTLAIAASLILAIFLAWIYFPDSNQEDLLVADNNVPAKEEKAEGKSDDKSAEPQAKANEVESAAEEMAEEKEELASNVLDDDEDMEPKMAEQEFALEDQKEFPEETKLRDLSTKADAFFKQQQDEVIASDESSKAKYLSGNAHAEPAYIMADSIVLKDRLDQLSYEDNGTSTDDLTLDSEEVSMVEKVKADRVELVSPGNNTRSLNAPTAGAAEIAVAESSNKESRKKYKALKEEEKRRAEEAQAEKAMQIAEVAAEREQFESLSNADPVPAKNEADLKPPGTSLKEMGNVTSLLFTAL